MNTKNELREIAKNIRNQLSMKDISEKILMNFLASSYYKNAQNISLYYPTKTEPDLTPLFADTSKNFSIPKISEKENKMSFSVYKKGINKLYKNRFGIFESDGEVNNSSETDLIIVPALMADHSGFRLGYGRGYYDRYLKENNFNAIKLILIPNKLLVPSLPKEEFDVPADVIITETELIKIQQM